MPATNATTRSTIARQGGRAAFAKHGGQIAKPAWTASQAAARQRAIARFSIPLDAPDFEERVQAGISFERSQFARMPRHKRSSK